VENRRLDAEAEKEREEREIRKLEAERERCRMELEAQAEARKLEMEMKKMELEKEIKILEFRGMQERDTENSGEVEERSGPAQGWYESLAGRTKRFGETLRHVLPSMPIEIAELPQFFDTIEKLYEMYEVPADLQAKLLIPLLTSHAKSVIGRMSIADMEQYDSVKEFLLAEFKLTPREYKSRFESASKTADETYVLFAARLRNLLSYYLRSRDVGKDFDKLCELIVSDRLKACLPNCPLNYVLSLEGNEWFTPDKVATLADIFVNNHKQHATTAQPRAAEFRTTTRISTASANVGIQSSGQPASPRPQQVNSWIVKRCYRCHSTTHLARACPRGCGRGGYTRGQISRPQVNLCTTVERSVFQENEISKLPGEKNIGQWEFSEFPTGDVSTDKMVPEVKLSPLKFVEVAVNNVPCVALCDSGAQIPVISTGLFKLCQSEVESCTGMGITVTPR